MTSGSLQEGGSSARTIWSRFGASVKLGRNMVFLVPWMIKVVRIPAISMSFNGISFQETGKSERN